MLGVRELQKVRMFLFVYNRKCTIGCRTGLVAAHFPLLHQHELAGWGGGRWVIRYGRRNESETAEAQNGQIYHIENENESESADASRTLSTSIDVVDAQMRLESSRVWNKKKCCEL